MMMANREEEIYQDHVLDHYEDPYHRGTCDGATHTHEDDNPLCGDVVKVEIDGLGHIENTVIQEPESTTMI